VGVIQKSIETMDAVDADNIRDPQAAESPEQVSKEDNELLTY